MLKLRLEKYRKIKDLWTEIYQSPSPSLPSHSLPLPLSHPPISKSLLFVVLTKINTLFSGGPT
jgi:hypothetical protein